MSQPTSQAQPLTFAYSESEATRIIEQSRCNSSFLQLATENRIFKEYEREKRKLVGLDLHVATLIEYYKLGRIPRGLRVNLRPTIFKDNKMFAQKYEQIVNKCSFDIILLNNEFLQCEIIESEKLIGELDKGLEIHLQTEAQRLHLQQIENNLIKHQGEIEERKRNKFRRDELDYSSGRVYSWQWESNRSQITGRQPRPPQRRHQRETQMEQQRRTTAEANSETDTSTERHQQQGAGKRRETNLGHCTSDTFRDGSQTDSSDTQASTLPSVLGAGLGKHIRRKGEGADGTDAHWDRRRQPERRALTVQRL
ncbi:hypothetical protein XELAEV_18029183mg [Xenopus laevis]|uniref:Uncharacterized protein n=1 Tax=Xenopus laevis TaxID=8355 RepID=A0A974CR62_XENLA|nr:hypothetical protein XELAEV_18029183mg [Xenopus laevis]